jgi:hypothetical protein
MKKLNKYSLLHLSNIRFAKSNLQLLSHKAKLQDEIKKLKKICKFTKREKNFLISWLSEDLNIELEKDKTTDFSNPIVKKLLPTIIKKLKTTKRI